mmetsp:Transcript_22513/g.49183  ORF Transcript_22513/g.49183 Transcript_22513/m.49183 type:complete len:203 (+) Transcript_22513:1689-2297(+)
MRGYYGVHHLHLMVFMYAPRDLLWPPGTGALPCDIALLGAPVYSCSLTQRVQTTWLPASHDHWMINSFLYCGSVLWVQFSPTLACVSLLSSTCMGLYGCLLMFGMVHPSGGICTRVYINTRTGEASGYCKLAKVCWIVRCHGMLVLHAISFVWGGVPCVPMGPTYLTILVPRGRMKDGCYAYSINECSASNCLTHVITRVTK